MVQRLKVVVLQAPVSDREHCMLEHFDEWQKNVQHARQLQAEGKQEEMMPRKAFWAPITAKRFLDLQSHGGADDYFSSDLTDEELMERLSHVGRIGESSGLHVLVAFSGSDEYVPKSIDSMRLTNRLVQAMNHDCQQRQIAEALYLSAANHNLSEGPNDASMFVTKVKELLQRAVP
jgi:hypothetical protein